MHALNDLGRFVVTFFAAAIVTACIAAAGIRCIPGPAVVHDVQDEESLAAKGVELKACVDGNLKAGRDVIDACMNAVDDKYNRAWRAHFDGGFGQ